MAENKTKPEKADVQAFLAAVEPEPRRADAQAVCEMMARVTGRPPTLWGGSIVGFGAYHYRYESGREGTAPITGFSPRKAALVLYLMGGFPRHDELMGKLGKHTTGKSCLYIKRLSDVDIGVLEALVTESTAYMRATYETR
jgi:hypothetical protein